MTDPEELKELEEVTQHPGWARIKRMALEEFGPSGTRHTQDIDRMLAVTPDDPAMAMAITQSLQVIIKSRREIESFFRGVESRVTQLQNAHLMVPNQSRRGAL